MGQPGPSTARIPKESKLAFPVHAEPEPPPKKWYQHVYDKQSNQCLGRTCSSWLAILFYSIMYLIFLGTYFLLFLYASLQILLHSDMYSSGERTSLLTYKSGVGLSVTPAGQNSKPLIWYKDGVAEDYEKYVSDLDRLFQQNRTKRKTSDLGPCGTAPYGYGEKPCIIIRINKHINWSAKPLEPETAAAIKAPKEVQKWTEKDRKIWLHCHGYHSYDREHINTINYYPDPPGIDPSVYPIDMKARSPLIAVQVSKFTLGISLTVHCRLWYENGTSSAQFMLYVLPKFPNPYARNYLKQKTSL